MKKKFKNIGVYWKDVNAYIGSDLYTPTHVYTEGKLARKSKNYLLIKNPETILTNSNGKLANHPTKKPLFYYIPSGLIEKIVEYDEKK